ncbi:restriction endonuclease subunit S [Luminiphilus sp.]|nr:restriction endonuclease subunit S [Luminiphilus sp.]
MRLVPINTYLTFGNGKKRPDEEGNRNFQVFGSNGVIGQCDEFNTPAGTIVIGRVGTYCGSLHYSSEQCWVTDNAIRGTAKTGADPRYCYYLLLTKNLHALRGGSGQPLINQTSLKSLEVPERNFAEQKAIAHILGTLDDKIELNQKMNQTLEEIAKAIFKSWFVDFDPVRAKAEGRPTGLPPEIRDLFPDGLVDSEIGKIPMGWEVTIVSGFGNVVCGKTPSTKDPENFGGEFPFITIPDMRGNLISLSTERSVSEKGASTLKGKMLPAGSICVSCIATPGLVSIITGDSFTNQQINSIVPFSEGDREYLLFSMMTFGDLISSAGSGGSVFANLSTGRFKELPILQASEQIRTVFSKIVRPMLRRIELSQKEITTLSQLRDTLLPKLISGELRIPDAEKFLEEAGI